MRNENTHTIVLNETDSTNNYAMRLIARERVPDLTVVLSYHQQSGKGQQGNRWESAPAKNLLASIIIFPEFLLPSGQFYLSKIVSLALVDRLRKEISGVTIKWPNDIYIQNKKIGGILIETSVQGNLFRSAVIGIGLNLNQEKFSPELPNPVGLKQLTGREYDINTVAHQVRELFAGWYQKLEAGHLAEIDGAYLQSLFRNNEWFLFSREGVSFEARIRDIGKYGQLILEDRSGNLSEYYYKEIEFVI